jgi:hypothetical protein|nr:MAG TPA: homing endonuclease [Caudoviricetes sp.]
MKEVWKDTKGVFGYQVSNFGRVRSIFSRWGKRAYPRIMKGYIDSHGYVQVTISINGERKLMFVHRLVAKAFIPNPLNLEMVNHKDENPLNNNVDNLEWCTRSYNNSYGHATDSYRKKICCIHGETAYVFKSIKDASIKMNIPTTSIFNSLKRRSPMVSRGLMFYYVGKNEIPSFDEILEANRNVLKRIKQKGD